MRQLIYFLSLIFSVGCATGRVQVLSSPPEADVFVSRDGRASEKVGVTPFQASSSEVSSGAQRYVQLEVRKEGYAPETVLIPKSLFGSHLDLSLKLQEGADASQICTENHVALRKVAQGIARAQMFIAQRSFDRAEMVLVGLINEFPKISVLHDLLGNVFYLQKDLKRALTSYEDALRLDPESIETDRMVRRLRTMTTGDRMPSSGGL